jgi:TolB-like protein
MASDEKNKPKKPDRKHLLEEIRRRAEQAELRRIEDEEQDVRKKKLADVPPERTAHDSIPVPVPTPDSPPPADQVARDQKLAVLRERLAIAIERKKAQKASELLEGLRKLAPEAPDLPELEQRVAAVQDAAPARQREEPKKKKQTEKKAQPRRSKKEREKLPEWLEAAHSLYQQEKYDGALEQVKKILAVEGENEGALHLQEQITRAKQIIELVKKEEEKYKAEEAASFPTKEEKEPPPVTHDAKEVWGAGTAPEPVDSDFELAPEQAGPVAPPKPPVLARLKERTSNIRIPWKPILSVLIIAAAGLAGYVIVDYVKHAVSPPEASILVLPPTVLRADSNARHITEGLVEDLAGDLSLASAVRVVGAPTALSLRSASMNPVGKAKSVEAGYYLQWNVGRVSDWLALELSLFDTLSPRPVWVSRHQASPERNSSCCGECQPPTRRHTMLSFAAGPHCGNRKSTPPPRRLISSRKRCFWTPHLPMRRRLWDGRGCWRMRGNQFPGSPISYRP